MTMKHFGHVLSLAICWLGLASSVRAGEHIQDNLALFSDNAVTAANQQIGQVYKNHGWTIAIETRDAAKLPGMPKEASEQDKFLTSWTTKEYQDNRLNGVYLVIFKNPNKIRIHIDTAQEKMMGITPADTKVWINELSKNLKDKAFDLALLSSVGKISAKLSQTNAPKRAAALANDPRHAAQGNDHAAADPGPSPMTWVLIGGGVLVIFLILRTVIRGINQGNATQNPYGPGNAANMGQPGYGPGGYGAPGYGGRGGGFMSGMLGGLFGGMAGSWMYDKMSGGHQSPSDSGHGHFTSHDSSNTDYGGSLADNSAAESDSTTYGGDWGSDASSGSDFGGGGDFGGDAGGGGDW